MRATSSPGPAAAALGCLVLSAGCDSAGSGDQSGKVALVDLDEAARALGREGVMAAYEAGTRPARGEGPGLPEGETAQQASGESERQRQVEEGLIRSFRAEIRPVARRVAQEEGMSIVLIRRDDVVLYSEQTNDITEQVIDQLQGEAGNGAGGGGSGGGGGGSGGGGGGSGGGGGGGSGGGGSGGTESGGSGG